MQAGLAATKFRLHEEAGDAQPHEHPHAHSGQLPLAEISRSSEVVARRRRRGTPIALFRRR
jgi:hypothetical protein